jgi:hypothetical protein
MLAKCLNSNCNMPFRYLREGRIYHLEIRLARDFPNSPVRREYFWLCGQCCARFTVVVKNGVGTVQSRFIELASGEQVEQPEDERPFVS